MLWAITFGRVIHNEIQGAAHICALPDSDIFYNICCKVICTYTLKEKGNENRTQGKKRKTNKESDIKQLKLQAI